MLSSILRVSPIRRLILQFVADDPCAAAPKQAVDVDLAATSFRVRASLCTNDAYRDRCASILCSAPALGGMGPVVVRGDLSGALRAADWLKQRFGGTYADLRSVIITFAESDPRGTRCMGRPWGSSVELVPVSGCSVALLRVTQNPRGVAVAAATAAEQGWRKDIATRQSKLGRKKLAAVLKAASESVKHVDESGRRLEKLARDVQRHAMESAIEEGTSGSIAAGSYPAAPDYVPHGPRLAGGEGSKLVLPKPEPSTEQLQAMARLARTSALASSGWATLAVGSTAELQELSTDSTCGVAGEAGGAIADSSRGGGAAEGKEVEAADVAGRTTALNPWSRWMAQEVQFVGLLRAVRVPPIKSMGGGTSTGPRSTRGQEGPALPGGSTAVGSECREGSGDSGSLHSHPSASFESASLASASSESSGSVAAEPASASSSRKPADTDVLPLPMLHLVLEARDASSPAWSPGFPCPSLLHGPSDGVLPPLPPRSSRPIQLRRDGSGGLLVQRAGETAKSLIASPPVAAAASGAGGGGDDRYAKFNYDHEVDNGSALWRSPSLRYPCVQLASQLFFEPHTPEEREECARGQRPRPSGWKRLPMRVRRVLDLLDDRPGGRRFTTSFTTHKTEMIRIMLSAVVIDESVGVSSKRDAERNLAITVTDNHAVYSFSAPMGSTSSAPWPHKTPKPAGEKGRPYDRTRFTSDGEPDLSRRFSMEYDHIMYGALPFSLPLRDAYKQKGVSGCMCRPDIDTAPRDGPGKFIRLRLLGFKEQGDPNVPAGELTFVADVGEVWLPDPPAVATISTAAAAAKGGKAGTKIAASARADTVLGKVATHADSEGKEATESPGAGWEDAINALTLSESLWPLMGFGDATKGERAYAHIGHAFVCRSNTTDYMHRAGLRTPLPVSLPPCIPDVLAWTIRLQKRFAASTLMASIQMPPEGAEEYGPGEAEVYRVIREEASQTDGFQIIDEQVAEILPGFQYINERMLTAARQLKGLPQDRMQYILGTARLVARVEQVLSISNELELDGRGVPNDYFAVMAADDSTGAASEGSAIPKQDHRKYACRIAGQINSDPDNWEPLWRPGVLQWEEPTEEAGFGGGPDGISGSQRSSIQLIWSNMRNTNSQVMQLRAVEMPPDDLPTAPLAPLPSSGAGADGIRHRDPSPYTLDFYREVEAAQAQALLEPGQGKEVAGERLGCLPWYSCFENPGVPMREPVVGERIGFALADWREPSITVRPPDSSFSMSFDGGDVASYLSQLEQSRRKEARPATNLSGHGDNGTAVVARYVGAPFLAVTSSGNALACVPSSPVDTLLAVEAAVEPAGGQAAGAGGVGIGIRDGFVGMLVGGGIDTSLLHVPPPDGTASVRPDSGGGRGAGGGAFDEGLAYEILGETLPAAPKRSMKGVSLLWRSIYPGCPASLVAAAVSKAASQVATGRHANAMRTICASMAGQPGYAVELAVLALCRLSFRMTATMHGMLQPLSKSTSATADSQLAQLLLSSGITRSDWSGPPHLVKPKIDYGPAYCAVAQEVNPKEVPERNT